MTLKAHRKSPELLAIVAPDRTVVAYHRVTEALPRSFRFDGEVNLLDAEVVSKAMGLQRAYLKVNAPAINQRYVQDTRKGLCTVAAQDRWTRVKSWAFFKWDSLVETLKGWKS